MEMFLSNFDKFWGPTWRFYSSWFIAYLSIAQQPAGIIIANIH
jgi:hypothetical protein